MTQYNGWTNYETWRINLEILDGMTPEDFGYDAHELDTDDYSAIENFAGALESYVTEVVGADAKGFALDLVESFLTRVNWEEIAEHMVEDYRTEMA